MVYKSIFERVKNYQSNPIDEYHKIVNYIDSVRFSYNLSLTSILKRAYLFCDDFRSIFPTFDEILDAHCSALYSYNSPARSYYDGIVDEKKEELLNEFLTYCQIILILIYTFRENKTSIVGYNNYIDSDNEETDYCINLISCSIKCFNYKVFKKSGSTDVEIILDDPVAESVAALSNPTFSDAIISYLGSRDTKTKETALHTFIDLLEPLLKKYNDQSLIKKIREYVQLLRHPETKKDEKQYEWFFKDKAKHLDDIFSLCLLVQEYDVSKGIVDKFEIKKKE